MADILVVEDEPDMQQIMKLKLSKEGHSVCTASNGTEALEKIAEHPPDLILLDLMLPEMDGWEFCERVRKESQVPIIMVTAKNQDKDIVRGLRLGADEYITKPFQLETLVARVDALLRRLAWERKAAEEEIEALKRNITNIVSHELRTPLAALMGTLDLALQEAFQDNILAQREFITNARKNAQKMRSLVDDLITLVRIDQGLEIFRRPVSIQREIKRLLAAHQDDLQVGGLEVVFTYLDEFTVHVDLVLFRQAIGHLLSNAIKHSPQGGKISVLVKQRSDEGVEIEVRDQGPGIVPQEQKKIFERFYQIERGNHRREAGLGVGLFIARAIARAHGGSLEVISTPGKGCLFTFSIPKGEPDWEM